MNENNLKALFSDIEETGLLTLYGKAIESQSKDPILDDPYAVAMTKKLDPILAGADSKLLQRLVKKKIDPRMVVHVALRARKYDAYTRAFLKKHPSGAVINIGCGLDARFFRIDNGSVHFFDLDLPQVIRFKKELLDENARYQMISASMFDDTWMQKVKQCGTEHWLVMAEGVFMYFEEHQIKQLVLDLQTHFPGCDLVCEVVKKEWTHGLLQKMGAMKMKNRLDIGESAGFHFGLDHPAEMESWHQGIQLIDHWSYFDSNHKKLGIMRLFRHSQYFREMQYTVHYRLE